MTMKAWWEKEAAFEAAYASGRCAKDLWKYIPKKLQEAVDYVDVDSDGYWIYLAEGWCMDDERIIHCHTIEDLKADIKRIRKEGE
jgi:hypothetical protein